MGLVFSLVFGFLFVEERRVFRGRDGRFFVGLGGEFRRRNL